MALFSLDRLSQLIEREANPVFNSKQETETLYFKLMKIQEVLGDAESKGEANRSVKHWLKHLEDVSYEMDDLLDEWEVATHDGPVNGSDPWEKVGSLILSLCLCFKHELRRRDLNRKMISVSRRIDVILEEAESNFHFVRASISNIHPTMSTKLESISIVDESLVIGRESDKKRLVELLVSEGTEDDLDTQVVSIVGMGGVGKTSLAQLAYNDIRVRSNFHLRVWVSVSDPFDVSSVAKQILGAIDIEYPEYISSSTRERASRIKEVFSRKKFLVVLDDVWTEDMRDWEPFRYCLRGAPGSRILVTTRSQLVARMMGSTHVQRLDLLSEEECWKILAKTALAGRSEEEHEELWYISRKIARRCNGLPLAARTLGGMLAMKSTRSEWLSVLENKWWMYEDSETDLFRILKLSYFDLDPILRRCFLSCVVFPEDSLIFVDELIRIWMAYGFLSISGDNGGDEVQQRGLQYFRDLATRSFFQNVEIDEHDEGMISFQIHDVMRDLAKQFSTSERYIVLGGDSEDSDWNSSRGSSKHVVSSSLKRVRTFCARHVSQEMLPYNIFDQTGCVRVMITSHCNLLEVPQSVGDLIHLRYLDLSHNPIVKLPETVCHLYFLQTLDLEDCRELSSLPEGIKKLINLRHLLNRNTDSLVRFPQGLKHLTGLWTLSEVVVTRNCGKLEILGSLDQLQGSLRLVVKGLDEEEDVYEAEKANLRGKIHIQHLDMNFHSVRRGVMEALQPPAQLQTLRIAAGGYGREQYPNWIYAMSLDNLKSLVVAGFATLPPLGTLPRLEKLRVSQMAFKWVTREFFGDVSGSSSLVADRFPRLKTLEFDYCMSWEEWEDIGEEAPPQDSARRVILPFLQELSFSRCPRLKALPHNLLHMPESLQLLSIVDSDLLTERYNTKSGADWTKISHIPRVEIRSRA